MITESAARRLFLVTLTCMVLFLISCDYAYAQRGYLAVGGEYVFCLIPAISLYYEWLKGGE